ncbi:50S ribosomal protein L21 [Candidatus Shapirobacteria bacterium CG08_land_8_20_14_0_20_39_18]|uniref:Large ribosomal subunit protein bL21 n=1 Tax=Candidatus Shapirobacteria bacterium CG08_land_8_20_14_0_20_39_18 TaxID=1974883 RepID=A0A2M6XBV5_9BACT|nr:MAG: 50S ribosomal protein L21 [Candidatus Shapirobacteria bacterium CG08_land_8_20_14_0_20_39_18]PIY65335.1 MAG: 50S ribosomal protein L21 [Candidatus Shapirobacteria bacterium CG_4_10_14_0_8_um_filter_39_15]PJE68488.1 MAG: 50S ribosomal protein L21 [Candidatus Shapirobacteria bacterium CG10_big_fil_rev_8_21_14_0_10_38_8]
MKYAVIKNGGRQYKVFEGEDLLVDNLSLEEGKEVDFDQVLLLVDEDKIKIGQPIIEKTVVKAKVKGAVKGQKVRTAKFKAKSRYHKVVGYRHSYTQVTIEKISSV